MRYAAALSTAVIATLVIASFSFAQRDRMMEQKGPTAVDHLMGDMSSQMNDLSGMITQIAGMMKDRNPEKMKKMSVLMKDLSNEMMNMSNMMGRGMTDREMEKMHVRMLKVQKALTEMEMKK